MIFRISMTFLHLNSHPCKSTSPLSYHFIIVSILEANRFSWSLPTSLFSGHGGAATGDGYIMSGLVSDSIIVSLSLLMCCMQASVWWWVWCSTSPALMTRWWTGPESPSSSSITTTAGPSPSLPLPSCSKRLVSLCEDFNICSTFNAWRVLLSWSVFLGV